MSYTESSLMRLNKEDLVRISLDYLSRKVQQHFRLTKEQSK